MIFTGPRTPRDALSLKRKHMSEHKIRSVTRTDCGCADSCLRSIPFTCVKQYRHEFWSKSAHKRSKYVYSSLRSAMDSNGRLRHTVYDGDAMISLCGKAWRLMLAVPINSYYNSLRLAKEGKKPMKTLPRIRQHKPGTVKAFKWLSEYIKFFGDRLPQKSVTLLPYGLNWKVVHSRFMSTIEPGDDYVTYNTFNNLVRKHFPSVGIKKKVIIRHEQ